MPERMTNRVRGAMAAVVAAALAFGAAQAMAAPAQSDAPWCTPRSCAQQCAPFDGYCKFSNGICYCAG